MTFHKCSQEVLAYVKGAQALRKPRNRKRSASGQFVWTEESDIMFVLGLIAWADKSMRPIDARRSFFLESFLKNNGIIKSRKQIASRLQVLKGEWNGTIYERLLQENENPPPHRASRSPLQDDTDPASAPHSPLVVTPTLEVDFDRPYLPKSEPAFVPRFVDSELGGSSASAPPTFNYASSYGSEGIFHFPSFNTEIKPLPTQESLDCNLGGVFYFKLPDTETESCNRINAGLSNSPIGEHSINETYPLSLPLTENMRFPNAGMLASPSRAASQSEGDSYGRSYSCWSNNDISLAQVGQYVQTVYPSTS